VEQHPDKVEVPVPPAAPSGGAVVALLDRADVYHQSGDIGNEAATVERALRIDPNNGRLWNRLAAIRLDQGQPRQAEQLALKSNALSRGNRRLQAQNWRLVAKARWSRNDGAGARAAEKKAGELH
jgi:tetratricopeptide (TPR) repeat protein